MTRKVKASQTPPIEPAVSPGTVAPCARCQWPCVVRPDDPTTLPLSFGDIHAARSARGLCYECAVSWWLLAIDGLRWSFKDDPMLLALPQVQQVLLGAIAHRIAPLTVEPNWRIVIAQWSLPWPDDWPEAREGL